MGHYKQLFFFLFQQGFFNYAITSKKEPPLQKKIQTITNSIPSVVYISPQVHSTEINNAKKTITDVENALENLIEDHEQVMSDRHTFNKESTKTIFSALKALQFKLTDFNRNNRLIPHGMHRDHFFERLLNTNGPAQFIGSLKMIGAYHASAEKVLEQTGRLIKIINKLNHTYSIAKTDYCDAESLIYEDPNLQRLQKLLP